MTGYRAFSKKLVKCMPVMSEGFQIETEMSIFSLVNGMNIVELPITYRDRPEGSESKLNTFKDGFKVLVALFDLFKNYRPFLFFGILSFLLVVLGLIAGAPVLLEFSLTHMITKLPSAVLAASLMILAALFLAVGLVIDAIKNQTRTMFEISINQFVYHENQRNGVKDE